MRSFNELYDSAVANYKFLYNLQDSRPAAFLEAKELLITLVALSCIIESTDDAPEDTWLSKANQAVEELY